jgi:hypothetical protein
MTEVKDDKKVAEEKKKTSVKIDIEAKTDDKKGEHVLLC